MITCPEEKREAILNYIRSDVGAGKTYYKAKTIANEIGLSSREVGANLKHLAEEGVEGLVIERRAVTRATTWQVNQTDSE